MLSNFEKIIFLRKVSLFDKLGVEGLKILSMITDEESFNANEVVFKQGDVGDVLYIIETGKVIIYNEANPDHVYATLGKGDCFGEMAVLDRETRSASVATVEDSNMIMVDSEKFRTIVMQYPYIAFSIFSTLCQRIRETMHY